MKFLLPALRLPTSSQTGKLQTAGSLALVAASVALGMRADRIRESSTRIWWAVPVLLAHQTALATCGPGHGRVRRAEANSGAVFAREREISCPQSLDMRLPGVDGSGGGAAVLLGRASIDICSRYPLPQSKAATSTIGLGGTCKASSCSRKRRHTPLLVPRPLGCFAEQRRELEDNCTFLFIRDGHGSGTSVVPLRDNPPCELPCKYSKPCMPSFPCSKDVLK